MNPFPFFEITSQTGFREQMQGILGMARTYYTGGFSSGPVYHDFLFNQGVVKQNIFGVYFGNMDEPSSIQIGTYSASFMRDPSELIWLDLEYHYFWMSQGDAVKVGDL
jgi:hypothetical protein